MLIRKLHISFENRLLRNFSKLFVGSAIAKLLSFMAIPVITRLVSPEEFGEFSIFTSIMLLLAPLIALRYLDAIPIPKSGRLAAQVVILAMVLAVANATSLLFIGYLCIDYLTTLYLFVDFKILIFLYFAVLMLAMCEILSLWSVRMRSYGLIARVQILQSTAGALGKILFSFFGAPFALIYGQLLQNIVGVIVFLTAKNSVQSKYRLRLSFKLMRVAFVKYSQYPKFRLPSQFMLAFSQALPVLAVGKIYGQAEAGQLGLAFSVITVPVLMVVDNMRKLYYGEAARLGRDKPKELLSLTYSVLAKMVLVALPVCISMYFFSIPIFAFVFGQEWSLAGELASLYSVHVFFIFASGVFIDLLNVLDRQKIFLLINSARSLFVILSFVFFANFSDLIAVVKSYIFSISMLNFFLLLYLLRSLSVMSKNK